MRTQAVHVSWLDVKIGIRMLARYPGLTIVGTLALAVAIALSTIYFEAVNKWQNPRLPVRDADRIVSILAWDVRAARTEPRLLHDFASWRRQVTTIDDLGAAIVFQRNLTTEDRRVEPVGGAEITASAFRLMGAVPMQGRALTDQDEAPGAPPVVVIGEALWKTRFDAAPDVAGRTVQLGTLTATVVGVMPDAFRFPQHEHIWVPLRLDGSLLAPRTGPRVSIFGRLASGASMARAQAEFDTLGAGMAASSPATHRDLRTRVTPYAKPVAGGEMLVVTRILYVVNGVFLMLLGVISANVATLVSTRTAARGWEISVRSALGASRGRIITQLFVEALVLAALAAVVGLVAAKVALRWGLAMMTASDDLPFWIDASLSWKTMVYAAVLTVLGATIIGALPAVRLTRANVLDALRSEGPARSGLRFGGFRTSAIVLQVAFTVTLIPLAARGLFESNRFNQRAEGIGADRYLIANVAMEDDGVDAAAFAARARSRLEEMERRLRAEPGVEGVAFADRLPVEDQFKYRIEIDPSMGAPADGLRMSTLVHVSQGFFAAFGTSVIAGRDLAPLDFDTGHVLIVNESFARHVLGGRNPVGQRVQIGAGEIEGVAGEDWYEIVGMVRDFGWQLPRPEEQSAMYRPSRPVVGRAGQLVVRLRDPDTFAPRLRALAAGVDPTIRLIDVQPLAKAGGGEATMNWTLTAVAWLVSSFVLLLSAMGIHSLMAFIVTKRTREIGIRVALGARPGRIVVAIFSRAFLQIGAGILLGSALPAALAVESTRQLLLLLAADGVMLAAGMTACAVPLRRALRINPTEALRAGG